MPFTNHSNRSELKVSVSSDVVPHVVNKSQYRVDSAALTDCPQAHAPTKQFNSILQATSVTLSFWAKLALSKAQTAGKHAQNATDPNLASTTTCY